MFGILTNNSETDKISKTKAELGWTSNNLKVASTPFSVVAIANTPAILPLSLIAKLLLDCL